MRCRYIVPSSHTLQYTHSFGRKYTRTYLFYHLSHIFNTQMGECVLLSHVYCHLSDLSQNECVQATESTIHDLAQHISTYENFKPNAIRNANPPTAIANAMYKMQLYKISMCNLHRNRHQTTKCLYANIYIYIYLCVPFCNGIRVAHGNLLLISTSSNF